MAWDPWRKAMKMRMLRDMDYRTRRLKAGDVVDAQSKQDFYDLTRCGFAEGMMQDKPAAPNPNMTRRRLSPVKAAEPEPVSEPEPEEQLTGETAEDLAEDAEAELDDLEDLERKDLIAKAKELDIEIPKGHYVRKDELVDLIRTNTDGSTDEPDEE